jgi:hypothetical protein
MKLTKTIALLSGIILAAGCAHEKHQAQYDEGVAPQVNQSGQYNSNQGSTAARTTTQSDEALVNQVRQSLQQDPQIAPVVSGIQITANNGMVVISGTIQSREQKQRIESIIVDIHDVAILDDQLRLASGAMNPTSRPGAQSSIYQNGSEKSGDTGGQPANPARSGGDNSVNSVAPPDANKSTNNEEGVLSPTSNDPNSPPRIYHDAGSGTNGSTNDKMP